MTIISVSLTPELLDRLDEFVTRSGYSSRSEALRLAIRDSLNQFSLNGMQKGRVLATVTIISESEQMESHIGVMSLRNKYEDIIFGNTHLHIEEGLCIELFLVKGEPEKVMEFVSKAKVVRGVREANYTLTPLGK